MTSAPARPVIGVTCYVEDVDRPPWVGQRSTVLPHRYVEHLERAGGIAVVLPPRPDADDELAMVLARRAALTMRIQEHKEVPGHEGRDPAREAEIVERLAAKAPALGVDGWRRVVDAVITAGLDAAERAR